MEKSSGGGIKLVIGTGAFKAMQNGGFYFSRMLLVPIERGKNFSARGRIWIIERSAHRVTR
jgi:hypothetical protein